MNVVFELLCVDTNLEYEGKTAQEMVEAGEVDRKAHGLDSVEDTHGAGNGLLIYRIQPWEGAVARFTRITHRYPIPRGSKKRSGRCYHETVEELTAAVNPSVSPRQLGRVCESRRAEF